MAYRFAQEDGSVGDGLRRIASEQLKGAIEKIGDDDLDVHEVVHEVRKHCKKLRGLIRLVRPAFDAYPDENAAFRDAANGLSFVRDSEALRETFDALLETYQDQIEPDAFASVRRRLGERQQEIASEHDLDAKLAQFREQMVDARRRVDAWQLNGDGFGAIAGGLRKTYKRARKAMADTRRRPHAEAFHEWRKRVKYHWYHTRLLRPIWSGPMKARENAADDLGDLLGTHHDLAVFRAALTDEPGAFGDLADVEVLVGLIERRQAALEAEAFTLGSRLLAEPSAALARRWQTYWDVWRVEPPARAAALTE